VARGEQEKHCIDWVNNLFSQRSVTYLGEYGDWVFVKEAFEKAKPNSASSEFPDFLFEGGFIEHFQVASTIENSKGSEFRKEQNVFHQKCEENIKSMAASPFAHSGAFSLTSCPMEMKSPNSTYENYKKSFQKNWLHHINSRKACDQLGKSIFLIEMVGHPITIEEDGAFKCFYKLAYDRDILEYIYEFRGEVEYVVFTYSDQCEVVSISEIPNYKKCLTNNMHFGVGNHTEINLQVVLDVN
jgi:hypothetical protein